MGVIGGQELQTLKHPANLVIFFFQILFDLINPEGKINQEIHYEYCLCDSIKQLVYIIQKIVWTLTEFKSRSNFWGNIPFVQHRI